MNNGTENTLTFGMSVHFCNRNLPVALLDYLLCRYTKPEGFRTNHPILGFMHLCLECKGRSITN